MEIYTLTTYEKLADRLRRLTKNQQKPLVTYRTKSSFKESDLLGKKKNKFKKYDVESKEK